jgi:hypothetical protein
MEITMTKPLDPEIKALRAVHRALEDVNNDTRRRVLCWATAYYANLDWFSLPEFPETRGTLREIKTQYPGGTKAS